MHRLRDESYAEDLLEIHAETPAKDLVEVVRCRDCKYWPSDMSMYDLVSKTDGKRWVFCRKTDRMRPEDGYCYEGKRRDIPQDA